MLMKRIIPVAVVFAFLWIAGVAHAVPYTWTDKRVAWQYLKEGESFRYVHDLGSSFTPGVDKITSAELYVAFVDCDGQNEKALVDIGGDGSIDKTYRNFTLVIDSLDVTIQGLVRLNADGKLEVVITSKTGDFTFLGSVLVAYGDKGTAPVPEPATMLLLGSGLLGMGVYSRFRAKGAKR